MHLAPCRRPSVAWRWPRRRPAATVLSHTGPQNRAARQDTAMQMTPLIAIHMSAALAATATGAIALLALSLIHI